MNVAICCRWSDDDGNAVSIHDQRLTCREKAEALGMTVVAELVADGYSGGYFDRRRRPDIAGLEQLLAQDAIDAIIYKDSSRYSRDKDEQRRWEDRVLTPANRRRVAQGKDPVRLHFVYGIDGDDDNPSIWLARENEATMNTFYRRQVSFKVRKGNERRRKEGYWSNRPPFGARVSDQPGVPVKAETWWAAEFIFERAAAGDSYCALARELRRRGVPTRRGGAWEANKVRDILHSEFYSPHRGWKHACTVSPELWDATRVARRPGLPPSSRVNLLDGLLVSSHYTVNGEPVPLIGLPRTYCHYAYVVAHKAGRRLRGVVADPAAPGISVRADTLEQFVVGHVCGLIEAGNAADLCAVLAGERDSERERIAAALASLRAEEQALARAQRRNWSRRVKALDAGMLETARLLEAEYAAGESRQLAIPAESAALGQQLAALESDAGLRRRAAEAAGLRAAWDAGDRELVRAILHLLIWRIDWRSDGLWFTWRYWDADSVTYPSAIRSAHYRVLVA